MNEQVESGGSSFFDLVKLLLAVALLIGGIVAFYALPTLPLFVRWLIVLGALVAGIFVALQSQHGREFWGFVQSSRVELRKVVWPNREETMRTTVAVFIFILVSGIFFWLIDMVLAWGTKVLTGQGS